MRKRVTPRKPPIVPATPTLQVLTPEQATTAGFKSISNGVNAATEPDIFRAMEASLGGVSACWINVRPGIYEAARATAEILTD